MSMWRGRDNRQKRFHHQLLILCKTSFMRTERIGLIAQRKSPTVFLIAVKDVKHFISQHVPDSTTIVLGKESINQFARRHELGENKIQRLQKAGLWIVF